MALTDQQIRDLGILYLPLQQYLAGPFTPEFGNEDGGDSGGGSGSGGITFTNVGQTGAGGGANPFGPLTPTFSSEPGDPSNFRISDLEGTADYFPETTMFGKIKEGISGFFQPRVRGTLGDRLLKQSQGITSKIPSLTSVLGNLRSPFNPESPTYNAALPAQLNFLESATGTKVTGTSDNLKFTEGLALIGRDPNTGGLKYGPGSVLAGKNVISGFGTNDYETALNDYIAKMTARGKLSTFQKAKLRQAQIELDNFLADQKKEFDKPGGTGEQVRDLQDRIDRGEFDSTSNRPDRDLRDVTTASAAATRGVGGGGYTARDSARDSARGNYGGNGSSGSSGGSPGSEGPGGSDEMGSFRRGGLATILGY